MFSEKNREVFSKLSKQKASKTGFRFFEKMPRVIISEIFKFQPLKITDSELSQFFKTQIENHVLFINGYTGNYSDFLERVKVKQDTTAYFKLHGTIHIGFRQKANIGFNFKR